MTKLFKLRYKPVIYIVFLILICLMIFPIPIRVDKTITAVELALNDKSYCEPVNVIINGTYRWRIVGNDTFDGNIKFDIYPLTMNNKLEQGKGIPTLTLTKGRGSLNYGKWMDSTIFGYIHTKAFLNQFIVQIYEPYTNPSGGRGGVWSSKDGKFIVAPATNSEEALAILIKISNNKLPLYKHWIE